MARKIELTDDQLIEKIDNFIKYNRKICWEAEYEGGEFCIGEDKLRKFIQEIIR